MGEGWKGEGGERELEGEGKERSLCMKEEVAL